MNWEMFYLICFGVGLVFAVLAFAGGFHHSMHLHWHTLAHSGHGQVAGNRGLGPINGFTLTAFLCWFGGAGFLLERYGGFVAPVILGISVLTGLAGGALIFWFLAKVLAPHDRPLLPEDTEMTGVLGRVSGTIRSDGVGEILYSQNGARHSSPARSDSGEPIARDVEVVVMRYERGVAWVRRWDEVSDGELLTGDKKDVSRSSKQFS